MFVEIYVKMYVFWFPFLFNKVYLGGNRNVVVSIVTVLQAGGAGV